MVNDSFIESIESVGQTGNDYCGAVQHKPLSPDIVEKRTEVLLKRWKQFLQHQIDKGCFDYVDLESHKMYSLKNKLTQFNNTGEVSEREVSERKVHFPHLYHVDYSAISFVLNKVSMFKLNHSIFRSPEPHEIKLIATYAYWICKIKPFRLTNDCFDNFIRNSDSDKNNGLYLSNINVYFALDLIIEEMHRLGQKSESSVHLSFSQKLYELLVYTLYARTPSENDFMGMLEVAYNSLLPPPSDESVATSLPLTNDRTPLLV